MANKIFGVDMHIDEEYIKGSVEDIVKSAIVSSLGNPSEIVRKAVDTVMFGRVETSSGKPSTSSYGTCSYLDWLAKQTIEKVVAKAMQEMIDENSESLKQEMKKCLSTKKFQNEMTASFMSTVLDSAKSMYKMPVTVTYKKSEI